MSHNSLSFCILLRLNIINTKLLQIIVQHKSSTTCFSLFVTESGKVFACGWGGDGQTGLGTYENQATPALVKGDITTEKIVKIASTGDCVLALNGE